MGIENTALKKDIQWVITAPLAPQYTYEMTIHCSTAKNITPLRIVSIDSLLDFEEGFADEIVLDCMVIREEYDQYIYPNRDALTATLIQRPTSVNTDTIDTSRPPIAKQYRLSMKDATNQSVGAGQFMASQPEKYTGLTLSPIQFQLIDLAVEQMMLMPVGGIFRKKTPGEVLKSELTRISHSLQGLDAGDSVNGVQMEPTPANTQPREHIVIPHGIRMVDMADHIQAKEGGIYDAGIGCYYQRNLWWVYPLYDTTRFAKSRRTLTIIGCSSTTLPAADATYRVDGDAVTIVANGKVNHLDDSDQRSINQGNGVRFARAQNLMDKFTEGTTKGEANSQNIMASFVTQARDSGKNYAPFSDNRITDNPHQELSKLAKRQGQRIQLNWDRADPRLIVPGMPARYLYEADDMVYELVGCVLNMQIQTRTDQPGMISTRYVTGCALTLFVNTVRNVKA